jgi:putative hydrolase of the HAD superfamily
MHRTPVTGDRSLPLAGAVLALDVDGVLLDPGLPGSWQSALADRYGVDPSGFDAAFFQARWPRIIVGAIPIEPALAEAIDELGWEMTVDQLLDCWFEADFSVDHDVVQAVRLWTAAGARLALVTNQEHRRAHYLEQRLGALLPVSGMAYSAAVGCTKDRPQFFVEAGDLLGIPRHSRSVVFVDDSPANVETARRHGWFGIHYVKGQPWRSAITEALERAAAWVEPGPGR